MNWGDKYRRSESTRTSDKSGTSTSSSSLSWGDKYRNRPQVSETQEPSPTEEKPQTWQDKSLDFIMNNPFFKVNEAMNKATYPTQSKMITSAASALTGKNPKAIAAVQDIVDRGYSNPFFTMALPVTKPALQLAQDLTMQIPFVLADSLATDWMNENYRYQTEMKQAFLKESSKRARDEFVEAQDHLNEVLYSPASGDIKRQALSDAAKTKEKFKSLIKQENQLSNEIAQIPSLAQTVNKQLPLWARLEPENEAKFNESVTDFPSAMANILTAQGAKPDWLQAAVVTGASLLPIVATGKFISGPSAIPKGKLPIEPVKKSKIGVPLSKTRVDRIMNALESDIQSKVKPNVGGKGFTLVEEPIKEQPIRETDIEYPTDLMPELKIEGLKEPTTEVLSKKVPITKIEEPTRPLDIGPDVTKETTLEILKDLHKKLPSEEFNSRWKQIEKTIDQGKQLYKDLEKQTLENTLKEVKKQESISQSVEKELPKDKSITPFKSPVIPSEPPVVTVEKMISVAPEHPEIVNEIKQKMPDPAKKIVEKFSTPVETVTSEGKVEKEPYAPGGQNQANLRKKIKQSHERVKSIGQQLAEKAETQAPTQTKGPSRIYRGGRRGQAGSFEMEQILSKMQDYWEGLLHKSKVTDANNLTRQAVKDNLQKQWEDGVIEFSKMTDLIKVSDFGSAMYHWMEKFLPFFSQDIVFEMVRHLSPKIMKIPEGAKLIGLTKQFLDRASGEMARATGKVQLVRDKILVPFVRKVEKLYPEASADLWESVMYAVGKHRKGTTADAVWYAENVLHKPEIGPLIQEFIDIRTTMYNWIKSGFKNMDVDIKDKPGVYIHDIIPEGNELLRIWTSEGPKWSGTLLTSKPEELQTQGYLGAMVDYAERNDINFVSNALKNPGVGDKLFQRIVKDIEQKEGIQIKDKNDFLKFYSESQIVRRYLKKTEIMRPIVETQTGKSFEDAMATESTTYLKSLVQRQVNIHDPQMLETYLTNFVSDMRSNTYVEATFQPVNTSKVQTVDVTLPEQMLADELKDYRGSHLLKEHPKTMEDDLARMTIDLFKSLHNTKFLKYMQERLPEIKTLSPDLANSLQRLGNYSIGRELDPHSALTQGARKITRAYGWHKVVTNPSTQIMNVDQLGGAWASQGFRKFSKATAKYIIEAVNKKLPEGFEELSTGGVGNGSAGNAFTIEMTREGSRLGTELKNLSPETLGQILISMPDKTFAASDTLARNVSLRMILDDMMDKTEAAELLHQAKITNGWLDPKSLYDANGNLIKIGEKTIEEHLDWITRQINAMNVNYGRAGVPPLYRHPVWNLLFGMFKKYTAHQFGANVSGFADWVGRLRTATEEKGIKGIPEETWKILSEPNDPEIIHGARELLTRTAIDYLTGGYRSLKPLAISSAVGTTLGYLSGNEDWALHKIKEDIRNQTLIDTESNWGIKFLRNWHYNGIVNALTGGKIDYSNKQNADVLSSSPPMQTLVNLFRVIETVKRGGTPESTLNQMAILNEPAYMHHFLKELLITKYMHDQIYEGKTDYMDPKDREAFAVKVKYLQRQIPILREGLRLFMKTNSIAPSRVLDAFDILSSGAGFGTQEMRVDVETRVLESTKLRALKSEKDKLENKLANIINTYDNHEEGFKAIKPEIIAARQRGLRISPAGIWSKTIGPTSNFLQMIKTSKILHGTERADYFNLVVEEGRIRGVVDIELLRHDKKQPDAEKRLNAMLYIINRTGHNPETILGPNRFKKVLEITR